MSTLIILIEMNLGMKRSKKIQSKKKHFGWDEKYFAVDKNKVLLNQQKNCLG